MTVPLDGYLAALAAYVTVIGLTGRPRWRAAVLVSLLVYCIANLVAGHTTVLSLLITLVAGPHDRRRCAVRGRAAVQAAVRRGDRRGPRLGRRPVAEMRRMPETHPVTRLYAATTRDGSRLDVAVFDRDQEAADALYRFYRGLRLRRQISRGAPLSFERALERRALLSYVDGRRWRADATGATHRAGRP